MKVVCGFRGKGSALFKAERENCWRSYAMDPGYDYFEVDEEDPGGDVREVCEVINDKAAEVIYPRPVDAEESLKG